ncbi:hypothetical protein LINGRAHAP2_LOCUS8316, partial [Linum grandiflorum]
FPSPLLNFPPYHPSSPLILFSILLLLLPLRPQGSSAAARFLLSIGDSDGGGREAAASILFLRLRQKTLAGAHFRRGRADDELRVRTKSRF